MRRARAAGRDDRRARRDRRARVRTRWARARGRASTTTSRGRRASASTTRPSTASPARASCATATCQARRDRRARRLLRRLVRDGAGRRRLAVGPAARVDVRACAGPRPARRPSPERPSTRSAPRSSRPSSSPATASASSSTATASAAASTSRLTSPATPTSTPTACCTDGLVITIEPIIAAGAGAVVGPEDGWTVRTVDRSLSAHFEHTIVVQRGAPIVLTALAA